jgi:hypothetical protein
MERTRCELVDLHGRELIRIGTGTDSESEHSCPRFGYLKARPRIDRIRTGGWVAKARWESFTLGAIQDASDRLEFEAAEVESALQQMRTDSRLHPAHVQFAEHGVRTYLEAHRRAEPQGLIPVRSYWVSQQPGEQRLWELYAWGRRYRTADGTLREHRFLRQSSKAHTGKTPGQIAVAAYVTAFGAEAAWPETWGNPFVLATSAGPLPERVRVVDVSLADGSVEVLFDGSPDDVREYFAAHGRTHVAAVARGGKREPGSNCLDCKEFTICEQVHRLPGVLGASSPGAPPRTVSVSDLRTYAQCPAQAHARRLNLPREGEYDARAALGQAVHDWLDQHHREGHLGCARADLPSPGEAWIPQKWAQASSLEHEGRAMLGRHLEICAFTAAYTIDVVWTEPTLVFHDADASTLVIAKADMVYREDGSWVWREVKTTQKRRLGFAHVLRDIPQIALAVVLLSMKALGPDAGRSRVELEILTPDSSDIVLFDAQDPELVASCRQIVHDLTLPWRSDETLAPSPGSACTRCPTARWCPDQIVDPLPLPECA